MSSVRALVVLAVLGSLLVACGLILGLDKPQGVDLPPLPEAAADPCAHVGAPGRPAAEDEAGADVPPFWLALRRSYIGETSNGDGGVSGFDLDGTCTCDTRPGTAYDGGSSCVPRGDAGAPSCDFDGGVDNAMEQSFASFSGIFDANHFNQFIDLGEKTILIYIANYNGQPNDLEVTAGLAEANGIYVTDCDPTLQVNDNPPGTRDKPDGNYTASWRGCDKWHGVQEQFVGDPVMNPDKNVPKALGQGFVRDGKLIMGAGVLTDIPVFFGDTALSVRDPTLVMPLERVQTRTATDPIRFRANSAVLAGRIAFDDLAKFAFDTTYNGFYTCQNMATYRGLMSALCPNIDLAASAAFDHVGDKSCTAMSFAFRFDADVVDIDRADRTPPGDSAFNPCIAQTAPTIDELCPP